MTYGIDTDFLVAVEIKDHPFHSQADRLLDGLLADGHDFAIAPQALAEFIHIVTDAKRMPVPLSMADAIAKADHWWQAREVTRIFPDGQTVSDFLLWLNRFKLGRKRLLDTLLAASFKQVGIRHIITNNGKDFKIFGCFELVGFPSTS